MAALLSADAAAKRLVELPEREGAHARERPGEHLLRHARVGARAVLAQPAELRTQRGSKPRELGREEHRGKDIKESVMLVATLVIKRMKGSVGVRVVRM